VRAVLDTGVVLSALVFGSGRLGWLSDAWRSGLFLPLVSRETTEELIRALTYPKFHLDDGQIQTLLAEYLPHTIVVEPEQTLAVDLPRCRDRADQMFLTLAAAGSATALVAGDRALLELAGRAPFRIVKPSQLRLILEK
jgi:putative PIN family toxin of toxin-antitoxin system